MASKGLSTSQQAYALLREIGALTTLQGEEYITGSRFERVIAVPPPAVAYHFPTPSLSAPPVKRDIIVEQLFETGTGTPRHTGILAGLIFSQTERVDPETNVSTYVRYQILSDDGELFQLQRFVSASRQTLAEKRLFLHRLKFDRQALIKEYLETAENTLDKLKAAEEIEEALGLPIVSRTEAQQLIDFVAWLNST